MATLYGRFEDLQHHTHQEGDKTIFDKLTWVDALGRPWESVLTDEGYIYALKHFDDNDIEVPVYAEVLGRCLDTGEQRYWRFTRAESATPAAF